VAIASITSAVIEAAVINGNTIRHTVVALRTATAVLQTGLAAVREVIPYRTASALRKETLVDKAAT
jgi:hypothetical protein